MTEDRQTRVTALLHAMQDGDERAEEELMAVLYDELHRRARAQMRRVPPGGTLQATALVNEAYLRLARYQKEGYENRRHFLFAAARAMQDILVKQARRRAAQKRGGDWSRVAGDGVALRIEPPVEDVLALDEALGKLEEEKPELARLVQLRFFAGLSEREAAEILGVSERTVQRQWRFARARLYRELEEKPA